jgi:hypothetical protein
LQRSAAAMAPGKGRPEAHSSRCLSRAWPAFQGNHRMNSALRLPALLCIALPLLSACDAVAGKKDYAYFRKNIEEAKSVSDQCQLNGTSGMNEEQIRVCGAAREAWGNRNFNY